MPTLLLCLIWVLPESPRWCKELLDINFLLADDIDYTKGRYAEAERLLISLHKDKSDPADSFARREYREMKSQLDFELDLKTSISHMIRNPPLRKRFIIGWMTGSGLQFGAALVILSKDRNTRVKHISDLPQHTKASSTHLLGLPPP